MLTADLAIHAWDLARSTGQDDTLDPGAVTLLLPWTEANADLLTASGMFGPRIDAGPMPRMTSGCWACSAAGPEPGPQPSWRGPGRKPASRLTTTNAGYAKSIAAAPAAVEARL